jgi:hypothetical protein
LLGPIVTWELVRAVRRPLHFKQRTMFAAGAGLIVLVAMARIDSNQLGSLARVSEVGSSLAFSLQTLAIYAVVPLMLAGAICDERRQGNLELLLATRLSRRRIVGEKLLVGVGMAGLAMLTTLPFALLGPMMGGVEPAAVLRAETAAIVEATFVAAATLMFSARAANGSEALFKSYAFLFGIRYLLPYLEYLAQSAYFTFSIPPDWQAWIQLASPRSAAAAAWGNSIADGPSFLTLLLIQIGLAASAFEIALRSLELRPNFKTERPRRSRTVDADRLLDSDPLTWRATQLRIYDRNHVWRRMTYGIGALFFLLAWIAVYDPVGAVRSSIVILAIVYVINASLPTQWLINERKSGWFRELQLTPLTMDDVLRASIAGTAHHLKPMWRLAILALLFTTAPIAVIAPKAAGLLLFVIFLFGWLVWLSFWLAIEYGFTAETTAAAFLRNSARIGLQAAVTVPLTSLLFFSALALFDRTGNGWLMDALCIGAALCVAGVLYVRMHWQAHTHSLKTTRTALFVLEKTFNFGTKGGTAAWEDWVGVTRKDPNFERPRDVYRESLPKLSRSVRRR